MAVAPPAKLTKADYQSDQEVRWCPGCGDYAILSCVQMAFAKMGLPREKVVFVSGIGCSSRFPYYMNTFGFHTIHGRALPIATGIKLANPDLHVWVATGDGDSLSIGGNHLMHALRRNVDLKILLFDNRIYGLTKGQTSPTSEVGKVTKSTPFGSLDQPIHPVSLALASEATFVARTADVYLPHLQDLLCRAAEHRGSAFIHILQNCVIFNDGTFKHVTDRATRDDHQIMLENGKPLLFGKTHTRGLRLNGLKLEAVTIGDNGVTEKDVLLHDETDANLAYLLSRLEEPLPIGVIRAVDSPSLEQRVAHQIDEAKRKLGEGNLAKLLAGGETWTVK
jgi:2-oxoglutarate/2-oxoacid ferredoxin oxidoreductase subunit beta